MKKRTSVQQLSLSYNAAMETHIVYGAVVFPVPLGHKPGKGGLWWKQFQNEPQTQADAEKLFKYYKHDPINYALVLGNHAAHAPGLFVNVLDIDSDKCPAGQLEAVTAVHREAMGASCSGAPAQAVTGSGGAHFYFTSAERLATRRHRYGEFRAYKGLAVGVFSTHKNGNQYLPVGQWPDALPVLIDPQPLIALGLNIGVWTDKPISTSGHTAAGVLRGVPDMDAVQLDSLPARLRALIQGEAHRVAGQDHKRAGEIDRSATDAAIMMHAARIGMTASDIFALMQNSKHDAHWKLQPNPVSALSRDVACVLAGYRPDPEMLAARAMAGTVVRWVWCAGLRTAHGSRGTTLRRALLAIAEIVQATGRPVVQASGRTVAKRARMHNRTADRALRVLCRLGHIECIRPGNRLQGLAAVYRLMPQSAPLAGVIIPATGDAFERAPGMQAVYTSLLNGSNTALVIAEQTGLARRTVNTALSALVTYQLAMSVPGETPARGGRATMHYSPVTVIPASQFVSIARLRGTEGRAARRVADMNREMSHEAEARNKRGTPEPVRL